MSAGSFGDGLIEVSWFKAAAVSTVAAARRKSRLSGDSSGAPRARLLHASDPARLLDVAVRKQLEHAPPAGFPDSAIAIANHANPANSTVERLGSGHAIA